MFMKLGVKAPTVVADVEAAIAALEAKKKEYEDKRDKVGGVWMVGGPLEEVGEGKGGEWTAGVGGGWGV